MSTTAVISHERKPRMHRCLSNGALAVATSTVIALIGLTAPGLAAGATDTCPNAAFRTGLSADLPDCRADELVSPAGGKNGADIQADAGRTRAADDGSAVTFSTLTPFGDVMGTSIASDYMAVRSDPAVPGTNGWATHATTPPQDANTLTTLITEPLFVGEFSSDLRSGVFRARTPLTDDAAVANVPNLYLRRDLRTPRRGSYQLITPCPQCGVAGPLPLLHQQWLPVPAYAGTSNDFQKLLMESVLNLTAEAPAQPDANCENFSYLCWPRAYDWSDGQLRLAGMVPSGSDVSCGGSGTPCVPAPASIWGQGAGTTFEPNYPGNVVSDDGSRAFFTVPTDNNGNVTDGYQKTGRIYVRTADATTDEVTASERTDCAGDPTCGGDGVADSALDTFAPAIFWGASADGSRVFFTTVQALTDDAPVGGDRSLYMYDTTKPASDPHNLTWLNVDRDSTDTSNDVLAVLATSDNGKYVYFISSGQLVAGGPSLGAARGLFMWHDGEIAYVGGLRNDETSESQLTGSSAPQTRITPDGRHLVFTAHEGSQLLGYDHGACESSYGVGCREIYVYSADSHKLACASCDPSGRPATSDADNRVKVNDGGQQTTWHLSRTITDDGSWMFFSTREGLLAQDTNGKSDVYEYDVASGALHLITSGVNGSNSYFLDASPDGKDVFFVTRERRVGWDTDQSLDLYDARVDGGFPSPSPKQTGCRDDGCQGQQSVAPVSGSPGSNSLEGDGDIDSGPRPAIGSIGKLSLATRSALADGRKARLRVTVNRPGQVALAATAKIGARRRGVAWSSATATKAGSVSIPFRLSRSARVQLRRTKSLTLTLTLRLDGAPPKVVSITLKAPRAAQSRKGGRS